jgi:PAS domain S-box-containing protein
MNDPFEKSNPTQAEYFKDIVGTIREPLLVLDADLCVLSANRSFYKFFKVKAGETIGKLVYDLGDRQWDIPGLRLLLETILPQKSLFNDFNVEHVFPVIGRRILLLNARRARGLPDKEQWILLAFEDATERMEMERKLQASEKQFHAVFETASESMLLVDKISGQVLNSNRAAQDSLGYSNQRLRKKNLWDLGILKDRRQFRRISIELEKQGVVGLVDTTIPTSQGGDYPADITIMDRSEVIQCNIHEITERKLVEEELVIANKELVYQNEEKEKRAAELIIANKELVYQNEEKEKRAEELIIANKELVYQNEEKEKRAAELFIANKELVFQEEVIRKLNAELEQRVEERTRELHHAQEELVRKEKLAVLGALAGGVGHELRNPLGVISSSIYYLNLVQPDANKKIKKHHAMIEQEVHNATRIISDLLDYARVINTDPKPASVRELVEHTLSRFPVPTSVRVSIKIPADLPQVYADPLHVEQILGNLITNACQAMSKPSLDTKAGSTTLKNSGKLTISAHLQKKMVAIAVKDTGIGVTPENMEKLFEPLFSTKVTGIGLGLAVSKKLAEANGGRIEVESEVGKGSAFTLYLPLKAEK